jgi:hypothetical protein
LLLLLQVPWSNLGQQPVVAELDRLFLVAGPKEDDSSRPHDARQGSGASGGSSPEEQERIAKSQRVAAAEAAWLKVGRGSRAADAVLHCLQECLLKKSIAAVVAVFVSELKGC